MKAGPMRDRLTIQQAVSSRDDYGGELRTWQDWATVWASIEPVSGREYFQAQQIQSEISTKIRIRYLAGITSAMRATCNGLVYDIKSVIDTNNRHRELVLMCTTGVSHE